MRIGPTGLLVLAMLALAAGLLAPVWATGRVVGPFDHIAPMAGQAAEPPRQNWDILQADGALQFFAWRDLVFESWGRGEVPLWNPHQLAGTPLLANSQSAALYPPHIVVGLLRLPTPLALNLLLILHLAWAGIGAALLAQRFGSGRLGGLVAGGLFALSPFLVTWLALPSVITTCAWIPWCLLAVHRATDPEGFSWSRLPGRITPLALAVGMLLLAGHLQFAAYGLLATGILLVAQVVTFPRGLVPAVVGLGLGAMLAAPQLLPVLDYSRYSHRTNTPTAEGYAAYVDAAVRSYEFPALVSLSLLGHPGSLHTEPSLPNYWPALAKRGGNPAESAVTLGPILLCLIAWGCARRVYDRHHLALWALAAVALLLLIGSPLNRLLYFYAPGWSATGSPARIAVLFVLAMAVLAGRALGEARAEPSPKQAGVSAMVGLVAVLVAGMFASLGTDQTWITGFDGGTVRAIAGESVLWFWPLILAVSGAGLVFVLGQRPAWRVYAVTAALAVTMVSYSGGWIPSGKPWPRSTPVAERTAYLNDTWELFAPAPAVMPPNIASALRRNDLAGYDSLLHRDTVAFLADLMGQDPAPPANGNIMFIKPTADPSRLRDAGVRTVIARNPDPRYGDPLRTREGWYAHDLGGERFMHPNPVELVHDGTLRQVLRGRGAGVLEARERNLPGWTARVNGEPTPIADGYWRRIETPNGDWEAVFTYAAPGLAQGRILGLLAAILLVFGMFGERLRSRR